MKLQIENVGDKDFVSMKGGRQRGPRDNQFAFRCQFEQGMEPDIGNPMSMGGLASYTTIQPGKKATVEVDLKKWFAFNKPGSYWLRGSYYLEIVEASRKSRTLWEDFVCDEFEVAIK